jgi:hypothetical protein
MSLHMHNLQYNESEASHNEIRSISWTEKSCGGFEAGAGSDLAVMQAPFRAQTQVSRRPQKMLGG